MKKFIQMPLVLQDDVINGKLIGTTYLYILTYSLKLAMESLYFFLIKNRRRPRRNVSRKSVGIPIETLECGSHTEIQDLQ